MVWLWSGSARLALHVRDGVRVDGSVLPPLPVANTLTCANSSGRHIQDALAVVYQAVRDVFADADSAVYRPQPVREPPAGDEQLLVAEPSEIKPLVPRTSATAASRGLVRLGCQPVPVVVPRVATLIRVRNPIELQPVREPGAARSSRAGVCRSHPLGG